MISVVVADDHPVFREAIARVIAAAPGLQLVGTAEDGERALALIVAHQPAVALLDLRMPGRDGLGVLNL